MYPSGDAAEEESPKSLLSARLCKSNAGAKAGFAGRKRSIYLKISNLEKRSRQAGCPKWPVFSVKFARLRSFYPVAAKAYLASTWITRISGKTPSHSWGTVSKINRKATSPPGLSGASAMGSTSI